MERKLTCVDLFSGAGGLSRGFYDSGYNVVLGVDFDDAALRTFKANHGSAEAMKLDLFNHANIDIIVNFLKERDIELDVLVGGPPCQGFSIAGPRDMNDKRNTLYLAMVKLAQILKPKAVVLENVPGMISTNGGIGAKRIISDFSKLGYNMTAKILYAPDYGIPQIRKRVFFVGLLNSETEYEFPTPFVSKEEYVSCEDAIGDLPALEGIYGEEIQEYMQKPQTPYQSLMRKNSKYIFNHIGSIHEPKTVELLKLIPEGKNYRALPPELGARFKYHEALTRYHSKRPSLTINTGHRSHFHYKWNRIPTVRESARLQSFPDDFIFYGSKAEQYRQVGNAVPPILGQVVATQLKSYLTTSSLQKVKMIDLFAGCGGLSEGFLQTNRYEEVAAIEWLKPQVNTLRKRLSQKWGEKDADDRVMHFDIQREDELFNGWCDPEYGQGKGLDYFVNKANGIDIIIGGPPCQAYSVAGRVRDEHGMRNDYRNYLFEHYLNVVKRYNPKLFVFENVPGLLSAQPDDKPISEIIKKEFKNIGYEIINDLNIALVNAADYGVPQNRMRVVIVGVRNDGIADRQKQLNHFYNELLPKYKVGQRVTVREAIGDLPPCIPYYDDEHHKMRISHSTPKTNISWHIPRYSNPRDMDTFRVLAEDIATGKREYNSKKINELYEEKVGSKSPIHRYHVLEPNEPSTTIIAHLYKDGNRFIHYDPSQHRTITVREAARLQSFPDDYEFVGSRGNAYQMIGNAVPPKLAYAVALAIYDFLKEV